eukprot:scaffold273354_cov35-Tisochrysis_lutea.AAC.1
MHLRKCESHKASRTLSSIRRALRTCGAERLCSAPASRRVRPALRKIPSSSVIWTCKRSQRSKAMEMKVSADGRREGGKWPRTSRGERRQCDRWKKNGSGSAPTRSCQPDFSKR